MTGYYLYSGATGTGDGSSWANAFTTIASAAAGMVAGDTLYIASDHSETAGTSLTITFPGTPDNPNILLSVNRAGSVPPVSADLLAGARIERTTSSGTIIVAGGHTYQYGITWDSLGTNLTIGSGASSVNWGHVFENCVLGCANSSIRAVSLGSLGSGTNTNGRIILKNTQFFFRHVSNNIRLSCDIEWIDTSTPFPNIVPTIAFVNASSFGAGGAAKIRGIDFSALGSGNTLVKGDAGGNYNFRFANCKFGASMPILSGDIGSPGRIEVDIDNCDSADTGMTGAAFARFERYRYSGSVVQETTIVRSSGAEDPEGNTVSQKMVTNVNSNFVIPLSGVPIAFVYTGTLGSPVTATVEIVNDGDTLTDGEIWGEVEYLGTSGFPLASFANDAKADILAIAANQTTSSATWTTTGLTTPIKQKLEVTFTPQEEGVYFFVPRLAKASKTVYVDPLVSVA